MGGAREGKRDEKRNDKRNKIPIKPNNNSFSKHLSSKANKLALQQTATYVWRRVITPEPCKRFVLARVDRCDDEMRHSSFVSRAAAAVMHEARALAGVASSPHRAALLQDCSAATTAEVRIELQLGYDDASEAIVRPPGHRS